MLVVTTTMRQRTQPRDPSSRAPPAARTHRPGPRRRPGERARLDRRRTRARLRGMDRAVRRAAGRRHSRPGGAPTGAPNSRGRQAMKIAATSGVRRFRALGVAGLGVLALCFGLQPARATTETSLAGSVTPVATGALDQTDPHVSGDWVVYTDF